MTDLLKKLNKNPLAGPIVRAIGLPNPVELARADGGYRDRPFAGKVVVLSRTAGGYAAAHLQQVLEHAGAKPHETLPGDGSLLDIVVMDATGCASPAAFRHLYDTFHPAMRRIAKNGRVLLVAPMPEEAADAVAAAAARGVEGFSRSLGKELGRKGVCVNLVYVSRDAADRLEGPVRFFCGEQATYVSGQAVRVTARVHPPSSVPYTQALAGKVALVTGAARGIGAAAAERLVQEGAQVICLDVSAAADALHDTCSRIGAIPLMLDIGAPGTPAQLVQFIKSKYGALDILVHNAGVTRDRSLANMDAPQWDMVIDINLASIAAIDEALLSQEVLRDEARIVCLSSISGIAGNFGQTNYAASKAALIGYVADQAPRLAQRGMCINAVAPGFIETAMTDRMPFMTREIGRRLNSLQQGGKPRDVAELISFLCTPGACGISGETIRVCGQGLIGA